MSWDRAKRIAELPHLTEKRILTLDGAFALSASLAVSSSVPLNVRLITAWVSLLIPPSFNTFK